ncbi:MAG: transposase [Planctomycetota bacterium]|nr:transposase [Planctomycetota bacterium]
MSKIAKCVGLDVHKDSISIAVAEEGRSEARFLKRIPYDGSRLLRVLGTLGALGDVHCAYEAGPTGYGLHRLLTAKGVRCEVVAPSEIPQPKRGKRVKTDRIDAIGLAHHLRSGNLTPVRVPNEDIEAMRDLVRAREDAKEVEKAAKHRLSKFLLRHELRYSGATNWTKMHLEWIRSQRFAHEAQEHVLRRSCCTRRSAARLLRLL